MHDPFVRDLVWKINFTPKNEPNEANFPAEKDPKDWRRQCGKNSSHPGCTFFRGDPFLILQASKAVSLLQHLVAHSN